MDDEPSTFDRAALEDLALLAKDSEALKSLKECQGLAGMVIADELGIQGSVSAGRRIAVLQELLWGVADKARQEARAKISEMPKQPKHPSFKVAAAGELLGLTNEEDFQFIRRKVIREDSEWLDKQRKHPGTAKTRQLRAATLVDGQVGRTALRNQHKWLDAFETAIRLYLADDKVRTRLISIAVGSEPLQGQLPATVEMPSLVPEPSHVLVDNTSQQSRPLLDPKLRRAIHDLADVAHRQLREEERWRRVSDPLAALPTRWSNAPDHLVDTWENIRGNDNPDPIPLAGALESIADVFNSVPSGQLVILGQGGSGKTVLSSKLALALLDPARRSDDEAVPIIFGLSSWNPAKTSLKGWMVAQLIERYPDLKASSRRKATLASQLVQGGHVLPILDGFDEIAPAFRSVVIPALNASLHHGDKLVLTSRPREYIEAVDASDVLTHAAVVVLEDLAFEDVAAYLPRTARRLEGAQATQTKWHPVLAHIESAPHDSNSAALREVLTRPLMVSLARVIYSDTPADPIELLNADRFPNAAVISDHLFDQFIQAVYEHPPQDETLVQYRLYRSDDARRWLGFLATFMFAQEYDGFAWWKGDAGIFNTPLILLTFLIGIPGVCLGIIGLWTENAWVVLAFICFGIALSGMLLAPDSEPKVVRGRVFSLRGSLHWREIAYAVFSLFAMVSLVVVTAPSAIPKNQSFFNVPKAASVFTVIGLGLAVLILFTVPNASLPNSPQGSSPRSLLRADRLAAAIRGVFYGVSWSIYCASFWINGYASWILSVPILVAAGVVSAMLGSASGNWFVRRIGCTVTGRLPRDCMSFFEDARDRGVLRQIGGIYQFRHASLEERLAHAFIQESSERFKTRKTLLYARGNLAISRFESGGFDSADIELQDVLKHHRRARRRHGVAVASLLLVEVLADKGQIEQALDEVRSFREQDADSKMSRRYDYHYWSRNLLADLLVEKGSLPEAATEYSELLKVLEVERGHDDPLTADVRRSLAELREIEHPGDSAME